MLPALKAETLGAQLNRLTRDDGARLAHILGELHRELEREPGNLVTATALAHALSLAGRAAEARAHARANYQALSRLPAAPSQVRLNVATSLAHAGLFADVAACAAPLLERADLTPDERTQLLGTVTYASTRSGDPTYLHLLGLETTPALEFLRAEGLADWWRPQQQAIEARLGPRVAFGACTLDRDPEGWLYFVLDYYTDATTATAVEQLYDTLYDVIEEVWSDHPNGPGASIGKIIVSLNGPFIPLPEAA